MSSEGIPNKRKVWAATGEEQKVLEGLFESGAITATTLPSVARSLNPIFSGFSTQVFGAHYRVTKNKFFGKKFHQKY